jgi:hypothetical protein
MSTVYRVLRVPLHLRTRLLRSPGFGRSRFAGFAMSKGDSRSSRRRPCQPVIASMPQLWAAAERDLPFAVEKYLRQGENPSEHVFLIADVWSRWGTELAMGSMMHAEGFSRARALEAFQLGLGAPLVRSDPDAWPAEAGASEPPERGLPRIHQTRRPRRLSDRATFAERCGRDALWKEGRD